MWAFSLVSGMLKGIHGNDGPSGRCCTQNVRPRRARSGFRVSGEGDFGDEGEGATEMTRCVQPTARGPRSPGPEEASSSFNKKACPRRDVPPVPWTSHVTALPPRQCQDGGARTGPQGPPLPAGCSVGAPGPPQKCEFHTCRHSLPPRPQMPWPLSETDTWVRFCSGQENFPSFHSGSRLGALFCRWVFRVRGGPSTCGEGGPGKEPESLQPRHGGPDPGAGRVDSPDTHTPGAFTVIW